ncbi:sulfatase [bacterium]|nr:sulfatase [bacterium]
MNSKCEAFSRRRPLGFCGTVTLFATMGTVLGLLYGVRDAVRACLTSEYFPRTLGGMLELVGETAFWYAFALGILMALVGVALWTAIASRGRTLDTFGTLGVSVALAAFVLLPPALDFAVDYDMFGLLGTTFVLVDAGFVLVCFAFGFRLGVMEVVRRIGGVRRALALACASAVGFFTLACWGLWMRLGYMADLGRLGTLLYVLLPAAAVGLAVGVYRLLLAALGEQSGELRVSLAALLPSGIVLACSPFVLSGRPLPLATPSAGARPTVGQKRPNVVWIVMDTCRADALSCYGNRRKTTPHLDRLAEEATRYDRAVSAAGWTLPSHASMFTGLLPSMHGTSGEQAWLSDESTTITEVLLDHGYQTFGRSANRYVSGHHNLAQGFEHYEFRPYGEGAARSTLVGIVKKHLRLLDYGAAEANATAKHWVESACRDGRPFFLFINYMEIHNWYGSTPYYDRWLPDGKTARKALRVDQDAYSYVTGDADGTDEDFRLMRALYEGDVTYLDEKIGDIVEFLRVRGVLDDTLLIVTSDHGEEFGEHGLLAHGFTFHNVQLHVPLIVRYPRHFGPGIAKEEVVQTIDLFPTILDVAGIDWPGRRSLQGKSLLEPRDGARPHYAISEKHYPGPWVSELLEHHPGRYRVPLFVRGRSSQDERYRYVWRSIGDACLYDVVLDPDEKQNLLNVMPAKANELRSVLDARFPRMTDGAFGAAAAPAGVGR